MYPPSFAHDKSTHVLSRRRRVASSQVSKGHTVLTMYIGKDAKLARQHRADVNAPKTPAPVFIMRDLPKVIVNLTENKHTICCMTRTMANDIFGFKFFNNQRCHLPKIIEDSKVAQNPDGITAILLVIDEVHQIYRYNEFGAAVDKMRDAFPDILWAVMGISSTPDLDKGSNVDNAKLLFSGDKLPQLAKYSDEAFASLKVKMETLPPKPCATDFQVINLPSPIGDKEFLIELSELGKCIVELMLVPQEFKNNARNAMRDQLSIIMAKQMHGADGGLFIDTICKTRDTDRLQLYNGETLKDPKESVLIFHKYDKAGRKHMEMLEDVIEKKSNSNPLHVVDLGIELHAEETNALRAACTDMSTSFNKQACTDDDVRKQACTTLGFASFKQHDGHDDFSKLASIVAFAGFDVTPTDLNQSGARVSRPFTELKTGEVVPLSYEAYLFDSLFCKGINSVDNSRNSYERTIPDEVQEALSKLENDFKLSAVEMKGHKGPVKKLLFADELLSTVTKWTLIFIDKLRLRYKKELEGQTDEQSDDGDDDEDDESDAEGDKDDKDEEESEESD